MACSVCLFASYASASRLSSSTVLLLPLRSSEILTARATSPCCIHVPGILGGLIWMVALGLNVGSEQAGVNRVRIESGRDRAYQLRIKKSHEQPRHDGKRNS